MRLHPAATALAVLIPLAALALVPQRGGVDPDKDPFKGVTTDGTVRSGLFPIRATGVTTKPAMDAAARFLGALTPEQRQMTTFAVDDSEWRRWNNVHRAQRAGLAFKDMTPPQESGALGLLKAALSAKGLEKTRNVMRLNHTIAEMTNNFTEYGEGLYNLVVFGEPSTTEPWGWQLEGHHLIINYFVLGDQVVMTPTFMGSEPVVAESGKYKGTSVLQEEQNKGLALMQALTSEQRQKATFETGSQADQQGAGPGVPRQPGAALRRHPWIGPHASTAHAAPRADCGVRRQYAGGTRDSSDGGSPLAPRRHLVRLDRRRRSERGVLLPDPQPGDPHRVRSPVTRGAARRACAVTKPRAHGSADAERERLRQGSAEAALRKARTRQGARAQGIAIGDGEWRMGMGDRGWGMGMGIRGEIRGTAERADGGSRTMATMKGHNAFRSPRP